jgi:hypothetical protein
VCFDTRHIVVRPERVLDAFEMRHLPARVAREGETVRFVTPLVHLPEWPLGTLSTDNTEGIASVALPVVRTISDPPIL